MELDRERVYNSPRQRLAWHQHLLKARFKRPHKHTVQAWLPYIKQKGVALDVGAHFGYIAKELADLKTHDLTIHAFEPIAYCHAILSKISRRRPQIIPETVALSDQPGAFDISIPVKASGRMGIGLSHLGAETQRDYILEKVEVTTLDTFADERGLENIVLIKADVEGAEGLVLKGGMEVIRRDLPTIVLEISDAFCQRMNYRASDIFDSLTALGYQSLIYQAENQFVETAGYAGTTDYLFYHPKP
ncbi:MAG: FkbM family methyltransferase [Parvibaculales bacterium]